MLLWLWPRPMATAQVRPLAWEPPYAAGGALKKKTKKKKMGNNNLFLLFVVIITSIYWAFSLCQTLL